MGVILGTREKKKLIEINKFRKLQNLHRIVITKRNCLKCGKKFVSNGIWNRVCETCTKHNNDIGDCEGH